MSDVLALSTCPRIPRVLEAGENYSGPLIGRQFAQGLPYSLEGASGGSLLRVSVDTGTDCRKSDALQSVDDRQSNRLPITRRKLLALAIVGLAIAAYRPYRMNHVLGG